MPQDFIVEKVLRAIRAVPEYRQKRILDLSCGEGEIIQALFDDGCIKLGGTRFKSEGDDYIVERSFPALDSIAIHNDVALDRELPFEDESHDIIICTEVIEHLPNHFLLLSEIGRILNSGGYLVLTSPNLNRLHSRLQFFFTGTHKLIRRRVGWDIPKERFYEYHINPVDFPVLHSSLHANGLTVQELHSTKIKLKHLYLMLLYPIIFIYCLMQRISNKEKADYKEGEIDLFKKLTGIELLLSEQLCVVARKSFDSV